MCKRIIECLRRVDWTFSEIIGSGGSILNILRKHIDFDALAEGHIHPLSPLQVAPNHGNGRSGSGEGQAGLSVGVFSSLLPATGQQGNTGLSPACPEARSEAYPSHVELQHYGWEGTSSLDLFSSAARDDDIFQLEMGDPLFLPGLDQDMHFMGEGIDLSFNSPD